MWRRKVAEGLWEQKAAEGLVGLESPPAALLKGSQAPFPTPNPAPAPGPETQASPALGVIAPLQVLKAHRRSRSAVGVAGVPVGRKEWPAGPKL